MVEKTIQKKAVSIKWVIVLGIVCIVLLAGLVETNVILNDLESQISEKNNEISSLKSQLSSIQNLLLRYMNFLNQSNSELADKDAQIASLRSQISMLTNYLNLNASISLVYNQALEQNANNYTVIWSNPLAYAGYLTVSVQSSSNTTYVQVLYSAFGVNYNNTITVGKGGIAAFPVLPALVEIRMGNKEPSGTVNATISIIYHY
jgi:hypothetical protein